MKQVLQFKITLSDTGTSNFEEFRLLRNYFLGFTCSDSGCYGLQDYHLHQFIILLTPRE